MHHVQDYLANVTPAERTALERVVEIVRRTVPGVVTEGLSYGMPALLCNGWAVAGFLANKQFLSYYPHSGKILSQLEPLTQGFECTPGSIHFSPEHPLPEQLIVAMVQARLGELEGKKAR